MLTELNGASPVLLALTGNDTPIGRVNWRKVRKVAAWTAAPAVMASIKAVKATKAALERKRLANIEKLKIERANRARKLAEAQKAQADAERAAPAAQSAPSPSPYSNYQQPEYDAPIEEVIETPDDPAAETETIDEGTDEGAEVMGYSRSNDDYFVGAPGTEKTALQSKQIKVVNSAPQPRKLLYIAGGAAILAYMFRKQLKRALRG